MKEKRFWKLEYTITLLVVFVIVVLLIPTSIQSTLQADLIGRWKDCYSRFSYMQDVISKHEQENMLAKLNRTSDKKEREKLIMVLIKPYFRLTEFKYSKHYHPKYMNGSKIMQGDLYNFTELYTGGNNIIVGLQDLNDESEDDAMFMMMFDVNGIMPPNIWGKDIFGAKVFKDRVDPIGKSLPLDTMRNDCSQEGTGVSCSYYYTIGGSFVE